MKLDQVIQRIRESKRITEEDKETLIRLVQWIQTCINNIRDAMHRLIQFLHQHQTLCLGVGITILLAMLAALVPFIGQLLAMLTLIIGLFWSVAADLKANLNALFQMVDVEKGASQI